MGAAGVGAWLRHAAPAVAAVERRASFAHRAGAARSGPRGSAAAQRRGLIFAALPHHLSFDRNRRDSHFVPQYRFGRRVGQPCSADAACSIITTTIIPRPSNRVRWKCRRIWRRRPVPTNSSCRRRQRRARRRDFERQRRCSRRSSVPPSSTPPAAAGAMQTEAGLHVTDSVDHTWQRVGIALERAQVGTISERDEAGHSYTLEVQGLKASTPEPQEHHWYTRILHPFGGGKVERRSGQRPPQRESDPGRRRFARGCARRRRTMHRRAKRRAACSTRCANVCPNRSNRPARIARRSAFQQRQFAGLAVPFLGVGGRVLAFGQHRPLLRQLGIERMKCSWPAGHVVFGEDRVGRAFRLAQRAVDAFFRDR